MMKYYIALSFLLIIFKNTYSQEPCPKLFVDSKSNSLFDSILKENCSNLFLSDENILPFRSNDTCRFNIFFNSKRLIDTIKTEFYTVHNIQKNVINKDSLVFYVFGEDSTKPMLFKFEINENLKSIKSEEFLKKDTLKFERLNFDQVGLLPIIKLDRSNNKSLIFINSHGILITNEIKSINTASKCDPISKLMVLNDTLVVRYDSLAKTIQKVISFKNTNITSFDNNVARTDSSTTSTSRIYKYLNYDNKQLNYLNIKYDSLGLMRNNYAVIKQGNKYGITEKMAGRIYINKIKDFEKIVRPGNEDWFFCYPNSDSAYLYNSKYGLSTHEKFAKPKLIFSSSDTIIILSEKIISIIPIKNSLFQKTISFAPIDKNIENVRYSIDKRLFLMNYKLVNGNKEKVNGYIKLDLKTKKVFYGSTIDSKEKIISGLPFTNNYAIVKIRNDKEMIIKESDIIWEKTLQK